MTREEAHEALQTVKSYLHERFPGHHARLQQLDSHVATVAMVVDHIHDEDERGAPAQ